MAENMKEWALTYADLGLAVFPVKSWGKSINEFKAPLTKNGFKDATTDATTIENWWTRYPNANIGIATGSRSGGLVAIDMDVDEDKGIDGRYMLRQWESDHGALPEDTWLAITGRGGYHYFFQDSSEVCCRTGLYEGIDIRGEGGYIVAPPSLHFNGNHYEWEQQPGDYDLVTSCPIIKEFLHPSKVSEHKGYQVPEQIPDGERTNALIAMIGSSKAKGWSEDAIKVAVKAENDLKCVPPLTDQELERFVFPALKRGWKVEKPYYQNSGGSEGEKSNFGIIGIFEKPDEKSLLPFPVESLPPLLREYILEVSDSLQVATDMVAVAVLGIMASCIQGDLYIEPKPDWQEPLNLYILIVAKPSERKTPTLKEVTKPIYDYVAEENIRRTPAYNEYLVKKKILANRVDDLMKKASNTRGKVKETVSIQDVVSAQKELAELEEVTLMKLLVDDITSEAMVKVMKENNERISIMTAEGGIFGMLAGRYSNQPNMDIFLKAYSGERYSTERMTRKGEDLDHPLLTLLVMVQPIIIQEAMQNREFRERGLLARFLYSIPSSRVGSRVYDSKPIKESTRKKYMDLVRELLSIGIHEWSLEENTIRLSEEAYQVSEQFFNEIEHQLTGEYEEIEDWAGKYHGQTMRIAGLLHTINHTLNAPRCLLHEQTMKDAIIIGRYFLAHAQTAFRISGLGIPQVEKDAKYILKRIEERKSDLKIKNTKNTNNIKFITKRNLWQLCKGHFTSIEEMQPGLDELEERNYIRITKQSNGGRGRPSEIIEINPEYWGLKGDKEYEAKYQ